MKTCCKCKEQKDISSFNKYVRAKDGLNSRCKICQREYNRNLYLTSEKRRKQIRDVDRNLKFKRKAWVDSYKENKGCSDCGITNPIVLDFDHLSDKKGNVSDMVSRQTSWEKLKAEIDKCEVVCSNCHRIRTYKRRQV